MSRSWLRAFAVAALTAAALVARADGERAAADDAFAAGRWSDAAALFDRYTAKNASDSLAWLRLTLSRLELGDVDAARAALDRTQAVEGRTARVEFAAGRIGLVTGDFESAARAFGAARTKDAAFEPAWAAQNLGYALFRLGRLEEARAAFRDALSRPPVELAAKMYVNAAKTELSLGAGASARELLTRGRAAFPADMWLADTFGWALALAGDRKGATESYARARGLASARRSATAPAVAALPMAGTLTVIQGPGGALSHESLRNAEACDLVILDERGRAWSGDGKRNEDHVCFDRPVIAAVDGDVVVVSDGVPDNRPGETNLSAPRGNFVYLRHGPNLFTRYFHLKRGSVQVRAGARVRRGDVLGRCGNSGFSTRPHLCFAVADSPPEDDRSTPFRFGPCVERVDGRDRASDSVAPEQGRVFAAPK